MAIAEGDVPFSDEDEFVRGSSLWRDAWRRLLKNKLAIFGLVVVVVITVASILGPPLIHKTLGFTPDYIPTNDVKLTKSFPPFTGPDGKFSWIHPMGTDNAGRDQLARVLQGGQISLFVGVISTLVSLLIGVSYGAIAGYIGGRLDNLMMRLVDVLYSLPYVILVIVLLSMFRSQTPRGQLVLLFVALGSVSVTRCCVVGRLDEETTSGDRRPFSGLEATGSPGYPGCQLPPLCSARRCPLKRRSRSWLCPSAGCRARTPVAAARSGRPRPPAWSTSTWPVSSTRCRVACSRLPVSASLTSTASKRPTDTSPARLSGRSQTRG